LDQPSDVSNVDPHSICTPSHRSWCNAASNLTHPAQPEIAAAYPCSISSYYLRCINTPIGAASARKIWRERCGLQRESRLLIAIQQISPYRDLLTIWLSNWRSRKWIHQTLSITQTEWTSKGHICSRSRRPEPPTTLWKCSVDDSEYMCHMLDCQLSQWHSTYARSA
jgi:hypothetical protein